MTGSILLVDDDDVQFLAGLRRSLDAVGYTVFEVTDGAAALRGINRLKAQLSLVVIDLALP